MSSDLSATAYKDLEELVMSQVSEGIKAERAKIEASFGQSVAPAEETIRFWSYDDLDAKEPT